MNNNNVYFFFWGGVFSQWFKSNFTLEGISFNTAEQYMMYKKAMLFDDTETAKQILKTNDPKRQKELGRKVKKFDMTYWNEHCLQIVFRGNHAKFDQNKRLYDMLMNTSPTLLVEASPFDKIWGIGMDEKAASKTPESDWPGTNWLGKTLTNIRDHFENEEAIEKFEKYDKN